MRRSTIEESEIEPVRLMLSTAPADGASVFLLLSVVAICNRAAGGLERGREALPRRIRRSGNFQTGRFGYVLAICDCDGLGCCCSFVFVFGFGASCSQHRRLTEAGYTTSARTIIVSVHKGKGLLAVQTTPAVASGACSARKLRP